MGNKQSSEMVESPVNLDDDKFGKKIKFGSISDPLNPRPGYYYNKNTRVLKYKIHDIPFLQGETNFTKLKYGYAKTNKRVFYKGVHIISANPNNFQTMNIPEVKKLNIPLLSRYNSVLGVEISNDKINKIYYKGKLIQ